VAFFPGCASSSPFSTGTQRMKTRWRCPP
jgi:hypothetical protein